jgi:hypothetical protein
MIDTLGRAQAVRGLPLLGENAFFCKSDGSRCEPDDADAFKFRLQGQKTKGTWSDWMTVRKTRKRSTSLTTQEHKRTCTVSVLAALTRAVGEAAFEGNEQPYPRTVEFTAYGSSFFVYHDATKTKTLRVMSCSRISEAVKRAMLASGFVDKLDPGDAAHVVRKHATSAVVLLRLPHIPDSEVHERAQHSAQVWLRSYKTEQCARHASAVASMNEYTRQSATIEEILRM